MPNVPFFRPDIGEEEIAEVSATLRSGWLTTGPRVRQFEAAFAEAVGAKHAIALNSATAALHLSVEAAGLRPGDGVLVPTMTFAATAEVVRYVGAFPILVDCDPETLNIDYSDGEKKVRAARGGRWAHLGVERVVGVMPVHVAGWMVDPLETSDFAKRHGLWVIEDSAHAIPAAWRADPTTPWQHWASETSLTACYSFYANKTITTGEGGMAVTNDADLAVRMRMMSLHGLSKDAWNRYGGGPQWDYRILDAGFKYNMTDVAAALGIHQLLRAEEMRRKREAIANRYAQALDAVPEIALPRLTDPQRMHSWHLFVVRLVLERLHIDRNRFIEELHQRGIGYSVHWRPLHLHPYYSERFGWKPEDLPQASRTWETLVTLPLFPTMTEEEVETVIQAVTDICDAHRA